MRVTKNRQKLFFEKTNIITPFIFIIRLNYLIHNIKKNG